MFYTLKTMNRFIRKAFTPRYLLMTNITISFGLSAVGDVIAQRREIMLGEEDKWDQVRTRNMSFTGILTGGITHFWYNLLDRKLPGKSLQIVVKKVILDQLICSPVTISVFFISIALLEGTNLTSVYKDLKEKWIMLYVAEWVLWPPAQFINFYILPHKYRLLFDSTISLMYDVYTSYVKHK